MLGNSELASDMVITFVGAFATILHTCASTECVFQRVASRIRDRPSESATGPVLCFNVGTYDKWIVDTRGRGAVYRTEGDDDAKLSNADAVVAVGNADTLLSLVSGDLSLVSAVLQRRLSVSGDIQKLRSAGWILDSEEESNGGQHRKLKYSGPWSRGLKRIVAVVRTAFKVAMAQPLLFVRRVAKPAIYVRRIGARVVRLRRRTT